MKNSSHIQRSKPTALSLAVLAAIGGCGVIPPGPAYIPPSGSDVAVVRPVWGDTSVRIREVNGKGVSMMFPADVKVAPGIVRLGLFAWGGISPTRYTGICVVFTAMVGQRYIVAVDSYSNNWAVSLTVKSPTDETPLTPLLVRYQESIDLPCDGVPMGVST